MTRVRKVLLAASIAVFIAAGAAWAEFKPTIAVSNNGLGSAVMINNKAAVRFRATNGSLSTSERAEITAERIRALVENNIPLNVIVAKDDKTQARVYAGDQMICIVMPEDAKAAGSTPIALATSWAENIRTLLAMPPVVLNPKELLVPFNENRQVKVEGAATGNIYAKSVLDDVASVEVDNINRILTVKGNKVGKSVIEVSVDGERAMLPVIVKKYAGRLPSMLTAEVTGDPCSASVVNYAARQAVLRDAKLEPGAKISISKIVNKSSVKCGVTQSIHVDVRITGPDFIPYSASVPVHVKNIRLTTMPVKQLLYSNDPERLLKYQTLFAGRIEPQASTRLLYHHQNMMNKRVHFIVELINPSPTSAKIRVFKGVSAPSADTVGVGHVAGSNFMRELNKAISVVEIIPPESRLILVSDMLEHTETASGIFQLEQLGGNDVFVRINAAQPYVDMVDRGDIVPAPNPLMLDISDHVYPGPVKHVEETYRVGDRWAFISIGKHALTDTAAQKKLYGNYGVTYDIDVKIENPTAETRKVMILFDPTAGLASGIFMIDGKFVVARNAQPPAEIPLASYQLGPGEMRMVNIVTIPLAGSNYPATIVVRS